MSVATRKSITMATKDLHSVTVPKSPSRPGDLTWADRSVNLVDLMKEMTLPVIVKMNADDKTKMQSRRGRDASNMLQQPLLLYKEMKGFKVVARNVSSLVAVKTSKDGVEYKEGGSVIVLPVQYQGWFRILEEDTVPMLNVATLARIMPKSFLSAKKVIGFTLLDPLNKKDIMYEKLEFPPGIYYVQSLYEDYVKYTVDKTTKRKLLRCLVCVTEHGLDVLLPLDVAGEFYIVQQRPTGGKNAKTKADQNACAYTLRQLLAMGVFTKPLVLKLLIGDHPNKPCGFTGVIKVFDIVQDWTLIALTLDGRRKLLELPVLPFPEFTPATNGKDLLEKGSLKSELFYMKEGAADVYCKEIKVKTSFQLEPPKPGEHVPPAKDKPEVPPLKLRGSPELKSRKEPLLDKRSMKSPLDIKVPRSSPAALKDYEYIKPSIEIQGPKSPPPELKARTSPAKSTRM